MADTIAPLIAEYDREDPDTPYTEALEYQARQSDYDTATFWLNAECVGTAAPITTPLPTVSQTEEAVNYRFLQLLDERGVTYTSSNEATGYARAICGVLADGLSDPRAAS